MDQRYAGKKLLLLGGVRPACEIINEAEQMGIETYVTDYLENSPAKKIADHAFMVNATDVDAVVDLCRKEGIQGVITGYVDMLLPYCESICRKLSLPFWGNAENIDMAINKEKFKEACVVSGVPVVPWRKANKDNYIEMSEGMSLPLVMKPVDNSGSRGVYKCFDEDRKAEYAEKALAFSKCGEILIEEAMDPYSEFSVYYIMNHGKCFLTGMGDRYVNVLEKNIAPDGQGMAFPSVHLDGWIKKMDPLVRKFFADNGMNDGFVFLQGFCKNEQYYIHEIGYRLNGGFSYKLIDHFSKYNQIRELIKFSLTGEMEQTEIEKSNPYFPGCGMIITVSLKPGKICYIKGIDVIENKRGVLEFYQLHEIGEELLSHGTTAQVFAYILCATNTKEEMQDIVRTVAEELVVNDAEGHSLINTIVDPEKLRFGGNQENEWKN